MGIVDETKKVTEEILVAYKQRMEEYQQRLKENEELISEVQKTLNQFRATHLEMASTLRANAEALRKNLKQSESERVNEFETLMSGIQDSIETIKKEVEDIQQSSLKLINDFAASREDMSKELKEEFDRTFAELKKQNQERLINFKLLNENIPKIRKSIILGKAGIFRQTFKLPFSRFHAFLFSIHKIVRENVFSICKFKGRKRDISSYF